VRARRFLAQLAVELTLTARRGESLVLTILIPVVLLAFLAEVHILPTGPGRPVAFLAPGILALAVMSTAFTNLAIATGFERGYGFLKRLGATPLGRPSLLLAKLSAVLAVELVQVVVLVAVALGLGWRPVSGEALPALGVVLLATAGFGGLGLVFAGTLRAEVNLAAANGVWLILLLVSGMLAPLRRFPGWLAGIARVLPSAALAEGLHRTLSLGGPVPTWAWVVLAGWALGTPVLAAAFFRWE
jgi:ABC-2 type transport system permease protein